MVSSHVQGIYGILTEKKKDLFFELSVKLHTLVLGGLGVVQGDRISSFLGEILF